MFYNNLSNCATPTIVTYTYNFVSDYKPPTFLERIKLILNEDDMKIEYFDVQPATQEDQDVQPVTQEDQEN